MHIAQTISAKDLRTRGQNLVDSQGRVVFFNGINLVYKGTRPADGNYQFYPDWEEDMYERLAAMGINILRFGILWAAMEPQPGQYDMDYFAFVKGEMDKAQACGISIILDMHQDLYAQRFSDGAPDWAVLTDHPYEDFDLWSDAYLYSPAVQESLDKFWTNARPEGLDKGLIDHYADLWSHIAAYFGGHPALVGYDILNEPAPGSDIQEMLALIFQNLAGVMTPEELAALGVKEPSLEGLLEAFSDPQKKLQALGVLNDTERYWLLGELCKEPVQRFEREKVSPFYERVLRSIREHDKASFILRGNNYMSNIGIPSGIELIKVNGVPDERQIFAPHGYDLTVDTPAIDVSSNNRAGVIFARHKETQDRLNIPTIVGEWGAFFRSEAAMPHGRFLLNLFDNYGWGNTYWCFQDDIYDFPSYHLLRRTRPVYLCGQLEESLWQPEEKAFTLRWQEKAALEGAESEIYLHGLPKAITLDGESLSLKEIQGNRLFIPSQKGERYLQIRY
jgi:endoglycosylceramidase